MHPDSLDFEYGGAARRHMALRAGDFGVLRPQRKCRGFVIGHGILRRFEAVHRVAGFAAAAIGPRQELPVVRIGLVAVGADIVRDGRLEVSAAMTDVPTHFKVLSSKRVLRLGVVELSDERALLPRGRAVAGFTTLLELSAMRIVVARRTAIELESNIFRYAVGAGSVTLLTSDLAMQSGQRELGFRVVEATRVFPVLIVMALQTVRAKLPLVLVFMARDAIARKAQVSSVGVLHLQRRAFQVADVRGVVALGAGEARVFAIECKTRLGVIELRRRGVPVQETEVRAVVLGMAAHARWLSVLP